MSIQSPVGTLDIKNATLRVGKLEVSNIQGVDTALNVTRANSVLIYDDQVSTTTFNGFTSSVGVRDTGNGYLDLAGGYVYWGQKLPNSWVMDFEMDIRSGTNAGPLYANVFSTTNTGGDGYSFTFNDSNDKISLYYDSTLLTETTVSGLFTASEDWQKVVINYERGLIAISLDGSRKFYYKDIERETPYVNGEYVSFSSASTDGRKIRDLRIVNGEKWVYSGESNLVYTQGSVGIGVTDPTVALDVSGTVKATAFDGDGSAITNISSANVGDFASNVVRIENLETSNGHIWSNLASNVTILRDEIDSNLATARTDLQSNVTILRGEIDSNLATARTDLQSNVTILRGEIDSNLATARTDLQSNVTILRGEIDSNLATARTDLQSNVTILRDTAITFMGTKTFQDDVVLESNLRVQGDLLVANTVNMTVSDPILELGSNNQNTGDVGLVMTRHGASNSNVAIFFDETADTLKLGYTLNGAGDSTLEFDSNALAVSVQGALTASTGTFSGDVGIGTTAPGYTLDVDGDINFTGTFYQGGSPFVSSLWTDGQDSLYYRSNVEVGTANLFVDTTTSRVGINTITPGYDLDVDGDINFTGNFYQGGSPFVSSEWTTGSESLYYRSNVEIGTANLFVDTTTSRVGINTITPGYDLDVHGTSNVGALTVASVSGNGSGLTSLNATNISSGTINKDRLPGTLNDTTFGSITLTSSTCLYVDGDYLAYKPVESGSPIARNFVKFIKTNNASYPFYTNRTPSGDVVIGSGTTAAGGEIERMRFKGGDGTRDIEVSNANLVVSGNITGGTIDATKISNGTLADSTGGVKAIYFTNTEQSGYYTDKSGILAFDQNFYDDTEYGTGTYDPDATFVGGNGGGLLIKNEDGWGAIFTSQNTRWAKGYWDTLNVTNTVTASTFSGSGSGLTSLNAGNLASGTVPSARLSLAASDIPDLSASKITSGTLTRPISTTTGTFSGLLTASGGVRSYKDGVVAEFQPATSGEYTLINFHYKVNSGSDRGFILVQDESATSPGAGSEDLRMTIGVHNDFRSSASHSDELWFQGGGRLVYNVGSWDSELDTIIGTPGVGTTGGHEWRVNNSTKVVINHSGNVGIGTTSPSAKLHIGPNNDDHIYLASANNAYGWKIDTDDQGSGEVPFRIIKRLGGSDATALTIKNQNGNVGIGTTSPATKLDVAGVGRFTSNGGSVQLVGTDHTYLEYYPDGTSAGRKAYVGYASATDNNFNISNSAGSGHIILGFGNVGIGETSPSYKLDVNGETRVGNVLYIGKNTDDETAKTIYFGGTSGDNSYNHCVIERRVWSAGTEKQELLLLSGNDGETGSGPDRIRLKGAQILFDTLNDSTDRTTENTKMIIRADGKVGIGTTSPAQKLHVTDHIHVHQADTGVATLSAYGDSQGTGRLYVGQSSAYGGGIEYNGDNSPASTGAGADFIT